MAEMENKINESLFLVFWRTVYRQTHSADGALHKSLLFIQTCFFAIQQ